MKPEESSVKETTVPSPDRVTEFRAEPLHYRETGSDVSLSANVSSAESVPPDISLNIKITGPQR